jgi:hypothetical protein
MARQTSGVRRFVAALTACASITLLAAACGSDSKAVSTTTPGTSPEEHLADDAAVTAGLGRMTATAATISATVAGGTKVDDAQDQLEVDWEQVEGTFRQNEPDLYLSVEEALNGIGTSASTGNAADTGRFSTDLSTAVAAYLAKHP